MILVRNEGKEIRRRKKGQKERIEKKKLKKEKKWSTCSCVWWGILRNLHWWEVLALEWCLWSFNITLVFRY
jgi:hypothetical protein